ncbi:MAG: hypothetical protein AAF417_18760 [Pseudomonadota bacterium]
MSEPLKIHFPLVGARAGTLSYLNCTWANRPAHNRHAICTRPKLDEAVQSVLELTRAREGRSGQCLEVLFPNADTSGESFGLALSLADKLMRAGVDPSSEDVAAVICTGRVETKGDQVGTVDVDRFAQKVELIAEAVRTGKQSFRLFVYPTSAETAEVEPGLRELESAGVSLFPVRTLEDLDELVSLIAGSGKYPFNPRTMQGLHVITRRFSRPPRQSVLLGIALAVAIGAIAIGAFSITADDESIRVVASGDNSAVQLATQMPMAVPMPIVLPGQSAHFQELPISTVRLLGPTEVKILAEPHRLPDQKFSRWQKVRVVSGEHAEREGWVPRAAIVSR